MRLRALCLMTLWGCVGDIGDGDDVVARVDVPPLAPPSTEEAATKYPDLRTLWGRAVSQTCGPNNGVCHNSRQFPDLQTAAGMLDTVGNRCNQIRDDPKSINNVCEPRGDSLRMGSFESRIGRVVATPTTIEIVLRDLPPAMATTLAVVRQRDGLDEVVLDLPLAAWKAASANSVTLDYATLADVEGPAGASMAVFLAPTSFAAGAATQVELGDPNGDGVFGAELDGALVKPGDPLRSYLFLRTIGPLALGHELTNVVAPAASEPQMPIANHQYWDIDNAVIALWCWIQRMAADGSNADGPIDYTSCDLSELPSITHQGGEATTFSSVYQTILMPSCAGPCHHPNNDKNTTFVMTDLDQAYDILLGIQGSGPSSSELPYVAEGDPEASLLYLKIIGGAGARMPPGAELPVEPVKAIETWILQGANNN